MNICKHFGSCGGCVYLDTPYHEELAQKELTLRETLSSYGGLLEGMLPAPSPQGYRNKMELAFGDEGKDGQLALGIRKRRSYYEVATVEDCELIPEDFKQIALCAQKYFRNSGDAFFHRKRHTGSLRHLVLRRGEFTGEILINISATSGLETDLEPLMAQLLALKLDGQIVGILRSTNDGVADAVKDEHVSTLWGRNYFNERICGLDFTVSAFSFFQTNSAGAEVLYGVVKDMATQIPAKLAYDLYCGTGTIALVLSPNHEKVIGIELNPAAIEAAKKNSKLNSITNCEFFAGDVQAMLQEKTNNTETQQNNQQSNPDIVVVDPPRDGLHPKTLAKLITLAPPRLVYVSCKPTSLARDAAILAEAGYKPIRVMGVDMFPRTPHVETVALLTKIKTL